MDKEGIKDEQIFDIIKSCLLEITPYERDFNRQLIEGSHHLLMLLQNQIREIHRGQKASKLSLVEGGTRRQHGLRLVSAYRVPVPEDEVAKKRHLFLIYLAL